MTSAQPEPAPIGDACPLCGLTVDLKVVAGQESPLIDVTCARCGRFRMDPDDAVRLIEERGGGRSALFPVAELHLVSGYLREMTLAGAGGLLLGHESALAMLASAPRSIPERADRLLLNLSAMSPFAGKRLDLALEVDHTLSYSQHGGETAFLLDHLVSEGLLEREPGTLSLVTVSVRGWGRLEKLRTPGHTFKQGFVAMNFEPGMLSIYDVAIAPAIRDAGYEPFVIAEHEHAGQIDDRILHELNRSRFVVAEFTGHRPNVYFEAGYALGRGLPVIWTCRTEDMDEAHFDTRQYNHLLWTSPEELREKLHRRISVVVG